MYEVTTRRLLVLVAIGSGESSVSSPDNWRCCAAVDDIGDVDANAAAEMEFEAGWPQQTARLLLTFLVAGGAIVYRGTLV